MSEPKESCLNHGPIPSDGRWKRMWGRMRHMADRTGWTADPWLLRLMLIALIVRLLVMPFFAHVDFLSEYSRIYRSIQQGNPFLFPSRALVTLIEWITLVCVAPLLPENGAFLMLDDPLQPTARLQDYFLFVSDPGIYRTLFLLKLPYLAFDVATALVLARMLQSSPRRRMAISLWLFNPMTIYAFYVFGRYESIALFFIAWTLSLLHRNQFLGAAFAFGLAIHCREIIWMYVPLFVLALWRDLNANKALRKTLVCISLVLISLGLTVVIRWLFGGASPLSVSGRSESDFGHALFGMQIGWMLPFFMGYALVCVWLWETQTRSPMVRFGIAANAVLIGVFLFATHSAHYPSWMMVFPLALMAAEKITIRPIVLFSISWVLYWLLHTDAGVFTLFLASPLSVNFFGWRTLPQLYMEWFGQEGGLLSLDHAQLLVHNLYGACLVYWGWRLFRTDGHERTS